MGCMMRFKEGRRCVRKLVSAKEDKTKELALELIRTDSQDQIVIEEKWLSFRFVRGAKQ